MNILLQEKTKPKDFAQKSSWRRFIYIVLLMIIILLLAGSGVLITAYFSSASLVTTHFLKYPTGTEKANGVTLPEGLKRTMAHISTFLREEFKSSRTPIGPALTSLVNRAQVSCLIKFLLNQFSGS